MYDTFNASYPTYGTWRTISYRGGKILRFDNTIGVTVPKDTTRIRLVGAHYASPDIEYSLDGGVTWTQVDKDFPGSLEPDEGSPYSIELNFCPAVEENSEILIRAVDNEFDLLEICVY